MSNSGASLTAGSNLLEGGRVGHWRYGRTAGLGTGVLTESMLSGSVQTGDSSWTCPGVTACICKSLRVLGVSKWDWFKWLQTSHACRLSCCPQDSASVHPWDCVWHGKEQVATRQCKQLFWTMQGRSVLKSPKGPKFWVRGVHAKLPP